MRISGLFVSAMSVVTCCLWASSPAVAQNRALIIANSDYNADGFSDLPNDFIDMIRKHNAVANAGWDVVNLEDQTAAQITAAITANKPPVGKFYFVWFSGHGSTTPGTPGIYGTDGVLVGPAAFAAAIGAANHSRTFVKLDSCGSGAMANAVNGLGAGPMSIGFQTAVSGFDCAPAGEKGEGSPFTTCYVMGLNGAADANNDGDVTVAEAATYATANCNFGSAPTWDGDYAALVIGGDKTPVGSCLVTLLNGSEACIDNVSEAVCTEKGGVFSPAECPTVTGFGLAVMSALMFSAMIGVTKRRRGRLSN